MNAFQRNKDCSLIFTVLFILAGVGMFIAGIAVLCDNSDFYAALGGGLIGGGIGTIIVAFGLHAVWDGYAVIVYKAQYGKEINGSLTAPLDKTIANTKKAGQETPRTDEQRSGTKPISKRDLLIDPTTQLFVTKESQKVKTNVETKAQKLKLSEAFDYIFDALDDHKINQEEFDQLEKYLKNYK
jgi:phosphotransferase system  glucose/maltose/N-acetylglucosamine-specific IIC component